MTLPKYALVAALGAALGAAPARAADPTELEKAADKIEKATRALEEARKAMTEIGDLRGRVITTETEITLLKQEIADLKRKLDVPSTTALKPDPSTSFRGQGRVRFINEHPLPMSVVVNGLSYRLAPGAERQIAVPPGEYTYQVLQIHNSPRVRQIAPNESKTFTIYAQD